MPSDAFEREGAAIANRVHAAGVIDRHRQGFQHQQLLDLARFYACHVAAVADIREDHFPGGGLIGQGTVGQDRLARARQQRARFVTPLGRGVGPRQLEDFLRLAVAVHHDKHRLWCHEPRPLMPRPREAILADRSRPDQATGKMILANVYEGRNMAGVKPGEIKKLLILESLPKPINYTGGMDPLSYGGTFTLERILGTVPVEAGRLGVLRGARRAQPVLRRARRKRCR